MDLGRVAEAARAVRFALRRKATARRAEPVALGEEQFTREEAVRIGALRRQYLAYPDSFRLDVNYQRAHFIRWLVQRGSLREGLETREDAYVHAFGPDSPDKWAQIQRWT